MDGFVKVAQTGDIPEGTLKKFDIDMTEFIIAHTPDGFHAFPDECSHDSAPFGNAQLHGNEIQCPRHGARFDVITGDALSAPAVVPIEKYELKIEGDDIFVRLD